MIHSSTKAKQPLNTETVRARGWKQTCKPCSQLYIQEVQCKTSQGKALPFKKVLIEDRQGSCGKEGFFITPSNTAGGKTHSYMDF